MAERKNAVVATDYILTPYTIVVDSREQHGFSFTGFRADAKQGNKPLVVRTITKGLKSGDYSLEGYEDRVAVERKSLADAYSTFSNGRDRFERELERLAAFDFAGVVVECSLERAMFRTCDHCMGMGFTLPDAQSPDGFSFTLNGQEVLSLVGSQFSEAMRSLQECFPERVECFRCRGTGRLAAVDRSKFSAKSLYRSIVAWEVRYPIHWHFATTRSWAERKTLRWLERFWLDEQERVKTAAKQEGSR